ncbi:hypothetical protein BZL54_20845 [Burkholderia ubonensis subsp. mesacidophila]|uniref:Uncharacterized protein n=1 Tax=Burkholderia ubonensis subsp. mesacidophila TaxID=265293 RepID=A0A2A4FDP1_9BURK|nr:hypothetical protein BZL54_20845 [Burkholderia ubonensis subsp. mesacidophila]
MHGLFRLFIDTADVIARQFGSRNIDIRHARTMPVCKSLFHIAAIFITSLLIAWRRGGETFQSAPIPSWRNMALRGVSRVRAGGKCP